MILSQCIFGLARPSGMSVRKHAQGWPWRPENMFLVTASLVSRSWAILNTSSTISINKKITHTVVQVTRRLEHCLHKMDLTASSSQCISKGWGLLVSYSFKEVRRHFIHHMKCGFTACPWTARDAFAVGMMVFRCLGGS